MIHVPRRSVTRFFIPLLDVMVLLFSMFLLMPLVQKAAEGGGPETGEQTFAELRSERDVLLREVQRLRREQKPQEDLAKLKEELARLREEVERLRKEKGKALEQRLAVRVLEIDPKNGDLVYYDGWPPQRRVLRSREEAEALIRKQRQEVGPRRELYYLFVFPRVDSAFPTGKQVEQYFGWFRDAAHGIDRPGVGGK